MLLTLNFNLLALYVSNIPSSILFGGIYVSEKFLSNNDKIVIKLLGEENIKTLNEIILLHKTKFKLLSPPVILQ